MVFDTTPEALRNMFEFAADLATKGAGGAQQGGFPQIGGVRFSFDPDLPAGSRLVDLGLYDDEGNFLARVVDDGQVVDEAPDKIQVVTINFTANGGDGWPIKPNGENFRYLLTDGTLSEPVDEALDFTAAANVPANALGEQKAFEDFLSVVHGTRETAYNVADTPVAFDLRIENLNVRDDAVFPEPELPVVSIRALAADRAEGTGGTTPFTFEVTHIGDLSLASTVD
jgi:hypothetical protein